MDTEPSHSDTPSDTSISNNEQVRQAALDLVEDCGFAIIGSNGPDGHPWIKAMIKVESEGLSTMWFTTNTSSARVTQFRQDPRASVYFVDTVQYRGLLLIGDMKVLSDKTHRERLWRYGNEMYYPAGIDDPDYCVLCFTAHSANYYHELKNITFSP